MFKALYFKELKHIFYTSRPAIFIFGFMMLLMKSQKVSGVVNISLLAGTLSLVFVSGVFMEEKKNKTLDMLLIKPIEISKLVLTKYLAVISMSLPGWIYSTVIFMTSFPKFLFDDLSLIFSVNLLLLHLAFYDTLRSSLPGASRSEKFHVAVKTVTMLFILGGIPLWIYVVSNNVPAEYTFVSERSLMFFKIFSILFSFFLLFASFKIGMRRLKKRAVSDKSQSLSFDKKKGSDFSVLVKMQLKRMMSVVFITLSVGFLLNIWASYIGGDSQVGSLGMTGIVIVAAVFYPLLPFFNNYNDKTFDYLHSRPISRNKVMLSFGISSLIGTIVVYLFTLLFVRFFSDPNMLERALSFGFTSFVFCIYLCTFWLCTVLYTKNYCKSGKGFIGVTFFIALFFIAGFGSLIFFSKSTIYFFYNVGLTMKNTSILASSILISGITYNYFEASGRIRRIKSRVPLILFLVVLIFSSAVSLKPLSEYLSLKIYNADLSEMIRKKPLKKPFYLEIYLAETDHKDERMKKIGRIMKAVNRAKDFYSACKWNNSGKKEFERHNFFIPFIQMLNSFKDISFEDAAGNFQEKPVDWSERVFSYTRAKEFSGLISLFTSIECPLPKLAAECKKIDFLDCVEAVLKYSAIVENYNMTLLDKAIFIETTKDIFRAVYMRDKAGLLSESDRERIIKITEKRKKFSPSYDEILLRELTLLKQICMESEKENPLTFAFYNYFHESPIKEIDKVIRLKKDHTSDKYFEKCFSEFGSFTKAVLPRFKNFDREFKKVDSIIENVCENRFDKIEAKPFDPQKILGYDWNSFKFKKDE
jgi:ABC-type transport system involved in multi-copper enzyme maturation permease subunit